MDLYSLYLKSKCSYKTIYISFEIVTIVCKHANDFLTLKGDSNGRKLAGKTLSQEDTRWNKWSLKLLIAVYSFVTSDLALNYIHFFEC